MRKLKIVFMGTPGFAVGVLDALLKSEHEIVGVITAADKPAGRGRKLRPSAVKEFALEHGLKVLQPTNLKDPEFAEELRSIGADLQVVVAFRMLPEVVWAMPDLGTFNLHASLLPQYRGAAPSLCQSILVFSGFNFGAGFRSDSSDWIIGSAFPSAIRSTVLTTSLLPKSISLS